MNWIKIEDERPSHEETILVRTHKGFCVCVFVDSVKMNETLARNGYANECVDINKNPYYFASQENKVHTLKGVTHWARLPDNKGFEVVK
jgi:hypothetical protein